MLALLIFCVFFHKNAFSTETVKVEVECAKQCMCTDQHISDLPMMKWRQVHIDVKSTQNETLTFNRVYDEETIHLEANPFIMTAFCVFSEDSHQITAEQFFPQIEALTILYARDTVNKTIQYELSEFRDLLALDIQGYKNFDSMREAEVSLHYNALFHLENLRYLNIEHVLLFPSPIETNADPIINENLQTDSQLEQQKGKLEERRPEINHILNNSPPIMPYMEHTGNSDYVDQRLNITFALSNEQKILPYDQFMKQQNLISTFSHLTNLQFLRIYHCHLETVTWDMFKDLSSLHTLSLEGNDIVEIPKLVFFSIPYLKILILSNNKLMYMNVESLAGLFELEYLDLSHNYFHHLSEKTFAPLLNLKFLDLRHNPVETIYSNTFEVMNSTETLLLGSNQPLSIQADAFKGLNNLKKLVIKNLHVEILSIDLLRGMPKIKHLEIDGNIDNIEFDAFTDSLDLEVLILKNCALRYVSVDAFFALFDLKILDLSSNNLETLPPGIFNQLDSLTELNLSKNRFVELPDVLSQLQHVKMLRLEDNPWNCTCDMASWRTLNWNKMKERRDVDLPCTYKYDKSLCITRQIDFYVFNANAMPKCNTPEELKGYSILYALNKKLHCTEKQKTREGRTIADLWHELRTNDTKRRKAKRPHTEQKHKINDNQNNTLAERTRHNKPDDNLDNVLQDLSQFINNTSSYGRRF